MSHTLRDVGVLLFLLSVFFSGAGVFKEFACEFPTSGICILPRVYANYDS